MENNKLILCTSDEMLIFCDLLQKEYNKKEENKTDKINIDNVLNKVFNDE